ncbi:MAG: hypothetical protein AAF465_03530 [Pseudomonadota bacterium]
MNLIRIIPVLAAGIVLTVTSSVAGNALNGMNPNAPPEVAHMGKLVGRWSTTEESLKPDGSGWQPSTSADWDFHWEYNGHGIRDLYVSPPVEQKVDDESTRTRGVNLRVYNPAEKKWVMTWLTTAATPPSGFTAVSDAETIVMLSDKPGANGFHSRITFFDIQDNSFEWKMEWSKDQKQWLEVHRIHGVRKAE